MLIKKARLKRKLSLRGKNQIWRIVIGGNDKLLIETRKGTTKEVFFNCFDLNSNEKIFEEMQLAERFWIGVEEVVDNFIIFHKYNKPDMPDHKGLIVYDIASRKVIWENDEYVFLFILDGNIYCYRPLFESRNYFALSLIGGEVIENLGEDHARINRLRGTAEREKNYGDFVFPAIYDPTNEVNPAIKQIIANRTEEIETFGNIEYSLHRNLLVFNVHSRAADQSFNNMIYLYDIPSGKKIFEETLNKSSHSYMPDSFFIYKDIFFILKEKTEVHLFDIKF